MTKYKVKWSRKLRIDRRVLIEWEKKVHEAIDRRVQLLRSKHVNKSAPLVYPFLPSDRILTSLPQSKCLYTHLPLYCNKRPVEDVSVVLPQLMFLEL